MEELLSLKWNNHSSTFLQVLSNLRSKQQYSDVTLVCEDKYYQAHRMILSTCSEYFKAMFDRVSHHQGLVIVLSGIKCQQLDLLLDYMYLGEVNVKQVDLNALIKASEFLQVKGLAVDDEETPLNHSQTSHKRKAVHSPIAKRRTKLKKPELLHHDPPDSNVQKGDRLPVNWRNNESIFAAKEEPIKTDVKEEPQDDFGTEQLFVPACDRQQETPQFASEADNRRVLEYNADHFEPQPPDILGTDSYDSNFASLNHDQSINWGETSLNMDVETSDVPSTVDGSSQRIGVSCQWCNKRFRCQAILTTHIRVHTGEKPFQCDHCDYRSTQKGALNQHIRFKHWSLSRPEALSCLVVPGVGDTGMKCSQPPTHYMKTGKYLPKIAH